MDTLNSLLMGFETILTVENLAWALIGCTLGMMTGIIPGFGPPAAASLLLPLAFFVGPIASTVMIAAIYYGSMYGGTITSVLLNVPGEISSVATCIDGYEMTKRGLAGKALAIAAIGSFVGGTIGFVGLVASTQFAHLALALGPRELLAIALLACLLLVGMAGESMIKGLISGGLGLCIGLVGVDSVTALPRFTFGNLQLMDGISFAAVAMGTFGLAEILSNIAKRENIDFSGNVGPVRLTKKDLKDSSGAMVRGTFIGFILGLAPGSPSATCSFASYMVEKRVAKNPDEFGKGAIQGVAGPETANNALGMSNYIPLLTLGIPSSTTMAILLGAFTINGLQPGPLLFLRNPEIAWGLIASLFVANVMLLVMALPFIRVWVSFLRIPVMKLYAVTLALMFLGAYSISNSTFDVAIMWLAGILGLAMRRYGFPIAPLALALVIGPMIEENLRRALSLAHGSYWGLFSSVGSIIVYSMMAAVLVGQLFVAARRSRLLVSA